MRRRILSAVILWPALGFALVYLPALFFSLLAAIAIAISSFEYLRLLVFPRNKIIGWVALVTGCICTLSFVSNSPELPLITLIFAALILFTLSTIGHSGQADNLTACALAVAGIMYIVMPLGLIILIRYRPGGTYLLGFLFVVTWSRDVGAFLFGRVDTQGPHFISRSISPRKTYEGALGGVLISILVALLARSWLGSDLAIPQVIVSGMLIGIAGQVGDLVESLIKRVADVVHSSNLIPGQGGLLDTLDSFIYTAPLLYLFATFWV